MRIIHKGQECGGFRPPKGHLDTQLFPECKGTPADRDIVKKTVEKRKRNKKNKSKKANTSYNLSKTSAHEYPVESKEGKTGIWEQWMNKSIDDRVFVSSMIDLVSNGFYAISRDPTTRNAIMQALNSFKDRGVEVTANALSAALGMSRKTNETIYEASCGIEPKVAFNLKRHMEASHKPIKQATLFEWMDDSDISDGSAPPGVGDRVFEEDPAVETFSYGATPEDVIRKKVQEQSPSGYPMTIRSQDEWAAISDAVNQGIDAHLEGFTRSTFDSKTGDCLIHPDEMTTFLRRLYESDNEEASGLRTAILSTLGIEEI